MATTVEKARRDVFRAKARLKRAEVRAGVLQRASSAGDTMTNAVTSVVTDRVAPAVHDVADRVVPAVHDAFTDKVVPVLHDAITDKVVPAVRETVVPAARKAARRSAGRSAALSREAAARVASTDAAQEARRRAEEVAEEVIAAATGKPQKKRRRWPLLVGLLGAGCALARSYAQRAQRDTRVTGPVVDRFPGRGAEPVDLTDERPSSPLRDNPA